MDSAKKKELLSAYKERARVGGVYCIECIGNHRRWIKCTTNLEGQQNRFEFSLSTKSCPEPAMRTEWEKYGVDSFRFVVLEKLKKKDDQTSKEFSEDVHTLLDIWLEKNEGNAI